MDIIIKSFNRPYYLERCIRSIVDQVQGDYKIRVLDDGTPPVYLQKIAALFPQVEIIRSPFYREKAAAIEADAAGTAPYTLFSVPSRFWIAEIARATDIFYLFEDDFWITAPVSLSEVEHQMQAHNLLMIKTYWGNNVRFMKGEKKALAAGVEQYEPAIPFSVDFLFHNRLKSRAILQRLKIFQVDTRFLMPLYDLYSVASAFYNKKYWLYIWEDAPDGKVNESLQLIRAVKWNRTNNSGFARFNTDISTTSYITSATNNYAEVDFDIFRFNHHLNQAWLSGTLQASAGYPADLPREHIRQVLEKAADPKAEYSKWLQWIERFKAQYTRFGFDTR